MYNRILGNRSKKYADEILALDLPQIDIYKITRHGKDSDKGLELISKITPEYAVVTATTPEQKTKELLKKEPVYGMINKLYYVLLNV